MLSVSATLKEALLLGLRNFWLLVALTLITKIPEIFLNVFWAWPKHSGPMAGLFGFAALLMELILDAANKASVLAILNRPSGDAKMWSPIWNNIQDFTWTLFRVTLLLSGIAILLLIPAALLIKLIGAGSIATFFIATTFLIFAKYALADPLVVLENLRARVALKRSWEMTRGHFWYVAGCYLILGLFLWFASWLLEAPLRGNEASIPGPSFMIHFCFELVDNIWIILAWVMYHRIKKEEEDIARVAKALAT